MVTIKQIAELCGVSRGTVDRVLNKRGNVKPEKERLIVEMAKKLNYRPNPAGKALAARKKHPVVGVLIASEGVDFFADMLNTMHHAAERFSSYGMEVIWRSMKGFDAAEQCRIIDELKEKISGLIINPVNDSQVIAKINECVAAGLFVVTINNDVEASQRHCYVGSDYLQGGRTAGALLKMLCPASLKAGVLLGSRHMLGHQQRLQGFQEIMQDHPDFTLLDVAETADDDMQAYEAARKLISEHPEVNALFVVSSGGYGTARAIQAAKRQDITIVAFDTIPSTIEMMKKGLIKAALYQHPHQQGRRAMQVMFDYLVNGSRPEKSAYIMRNEIRILENVADDN
ncbi:MAG: LacI family DNA-binding transcriptional regulator [Selenomonas sp.]|uniref:LacI family DNA-binding transcriptional regulator n=1 Tax=Selenomonas sp. TaxID=2053611 RepID=UPI0025E73B19|nr:LacI family DNA-binding transcriptional regulator [Selenomonas sp.]MCR5757382.1 LacI family DNA-binding transcriptional regulator [Selenomonas sp.]